MAEDNFLKIGRVRYADPGDITNTYAKGGIKIENYDARTSGMANVANMVNDSMGLSFGTDGIQKNYDIVQDYGEGGMSRFFGYNSPGQVSFFSIA